MSNFDSFHQTSGGRAGLTEPAMFTASTEDSLVTITATGYMNDKAQEFGVDIVKRNDWILINYLATDLPSAVLAAFRVEKVGNDFNLVAFP
jgi:hypothetical protein